MKKILFSMLTLASMVIFLNACKDDEKVDNGTLTIDGTKFSLKKGYTFSGDEVVEGEDTYYGWTLILASEGVSVGDDGLSGEGDLIFLEMYALNIEGDELPAGTYHYPGDDDLHLILYGEILLNFDIENEEGDIVDLDNVETAEAVITKSGSRYTIKITIKRPDEADIVVNYTGTITVLED